MSQSLSEIGSSSPSLEILALGGDNCSSSLLRLCSTDGPEGLGFSSCAAPFTRVHAPNLRRADIDG
jgi:hypothetical protein